MLLGIPEPLVKEARALPSADSETDAVVLSLQDVVRHKRIDELKAMMGHVNLEIYLPKSRRRSS